MDSLELVFATIQWSDIWLTVSFSIVFIILLLFASALVSGAEVAFFSLTPSDQEKIGEQPGKAAETTILLLQKPKSLLAIILITNNFINVAIIILCSYLSSTIFPPDQVDSLIKFLIDVVAITLILLLFGEVIPKVYSAKNGQKVALFMAVPLKVIGNTFPINLLKKGLVQGTSLINKKVKKRVKDLSPDDLAGAIELASEALDDKRDLEIYQGIVEFGKKDVKQVMRSRMDVEAVEVNLNFHELLNRVVGKKGNSHFSRVPVYKESFDHIVGVLFVKDLLPYAEEKENFDWKALAREPYFVPENKKIDDLLKSFQERKMHMAIVVDEYGGTSGIVTLDDVLEEIVGEISDEFDDEDLTYSKLDDNNYIFEGKTALIDMYKVLEIDGDRFEEAKAESDTIAGFIIEQAGKILKKNERVVFEHYTFTVEAADSRKIKRVKLTIQQQTNEN
ncbi:gliding motility-associated protein GldE [Crocinitomix catalasitica]|uniref:gliding motility-associated protein GldE n=1 Tax=Crocinitomix catalasitica TaxID=184607 RepID=UPI000487AB41|nr:gliding motility-associated protein GldE [Crocinitomix catalasitica]